MNKAYILRISFIVFLCIFIYVLAADLFAQRTNAPQDTSPTITPTPNFTLTQTKTDQIVAQITAYDNNTKKLKLKTFPVLKTDCSQAQGLCIDLSVDATQPSEKTIDIDNNFIFKFASTANDNCTTVHINTDLRRGTVSDLVKSKCNYIGSYSYFLVISDSAKIVELDEYIFPSI